MARHTIVKVCGITQVADARMAHDAGADWLGMIILGPSPRLVSVETARDITLALDGAVTVAVMVSPTPAQALDIAERAGVTRIQVHRVDPMTWPPDFPIATTIAVGVAADGALVAPLPSPEHLVLLDSSDAVRAGGTGRTFPWATAQVVAASRAVLLAGGLGPDNVAAAVRAVLPFGVDASSRLESAPGAKDETLVRRFVAAVREVDTTLDAGE